MSRLQTLDPLSATAKNPRLPRTSGQWVHVRLLQLVPITCEEITPAWRPRCTCRLLIRSATGAAPRLLPPPGGRHAESSIAGSTAFFKVDRDSNGCRIRCFGPQSTGGVNTARSGEKNAIHD